jgi:hypothetical protein
MAITEYYVDPSIAAASGAGTVGDPYGDLQHALDTVTRDSTNGDRFNVKAGTDEVLTAALDLSTYGTPSTTAPLFFQGYTTAQGDGGIGSISGAGTYSVFSATTTSFIKFIHMKLYNCGAAAVIDLDNHITLHQCEVTNTTGKGIDVDNNCTVINCYVHNVGDVGITVGGYGIISSCYLANGTNDFTDAIALGIGSMAIGNIINVDGNSDGIQSSSQQQKIISNSIYSGAGGGGTGHGIRLTGTTLSHSVLNNIIEGFNVGFSSEAGNDIDVYVANRFYNNGTTASLLGEERYDNDNSTLSASAFTSPAGADFSGSTEVKAQAYPSSFNGASTNQYLDTGAAQIVGGSMGSGNTLLIFHPHNNEPPSSNYATLDTRNLHLCLDFDATTNESAVFSAIMPQAYSSGGVTVYLHYAMTSATSGDIDWDVAFERIGDQQQDIDSDGFAAVQSVDNTTVPGTSGNVDVVSIAFTDGAQMDSVAVGESFRLKVTRDAASDTATGDAELVKVEIRET